MKFIDFNDTSIPTGKRKQAYVKYAVSKGTSLLEAQRQANKKFGYTRTSNVHKRCLYCGNQVKLYDHQSCEYCILEHRLTSPLLDSELERRRLEP